MKTKINAGRPEFAIFKYLALSCGVILASVAVDYGQTNYLLQTGSPTFTAAEPVELGFVNAANGNLHIEIPIAAMPQRGGIAYTAKFVYDSRIWQVVNNGSSQSWQPTNVSGSKGGWRFVSTADPGWIAYTTAIQKCVSGTYNIYSSFSWSAPDGTQHLFPITTQQDAGCGVANISSGDAWAEDSTGYHMYVTNFTQAKVYANDGTIVHDDTQGVFTVKDANGNFFSADANGNIVDTLGRTPVLKTTAGSNITYYDVLNSQNARSRFTVTTAAIDVCTSFGQYSVTEYCSGGVPAQQISVIQSIALPDGTSYSFNYDSGTAPGNYGLLTSMTLPTGGVVSYAYTTFLDSYSNLNRWVNTRTSGGGTWTYTPTVITTCAPGTVGCQQKNTLTRPSGDDTVYTFTLNNGAWNTQTASYNGSSSTGTLLRSVTTDFDFSNPCPGGCTGAAYIRRIRATTSDSGPTTLTKKTEYAYDTPQYGNITAIKEWGYYASFPASPDRETDFTYLASSNYINNNIINRVTDRVAKNGSGTRVAETATSYDSTALTSVTGITHHDDTNYGTGNTVRGNATVVQQWVSGTAYLSTTSYFDMTGQVAQVTDPAGHSTAYSYADNFFSDASPPANPPQAYTPPAPTNAYRTQATLPVSGTQSFGYYFGSGKLASSTDQNGVATYQHYLDALDRQTHTYSPAGGWKLTAYTSATQQDLYTGLSDSTPSTSCTGCRHDQVVLDGMGRVTRTTVVNDPDGATNVDKTYDTSGRVQTTSNPYRSVSDPTYGLETSTFDGLNRVTQVSHADGNTVRTSYGSAVVGAGGINAQLCSSSYGLGYPVLVVDETNQKRESWTDGLGRVIEVDEPDSNGNLTLATCSKYSALNHPIEVDQGSQTRDFSYDGLGRATSEVTPEGGTRLFYYTTASGAVCNGTTMAEKMCRRTDNLGITTTYAYDAENRLLSKSYSDSTPTDQYYYDETTVSVGGTNYTVTNAKGQLSHTSSAGGTAITIHSYDAARHLRDLWQCTPFNCLSASIWNMHYTYNLAGDITSRSHPAGFTITNTVSNARRLTQVTSSLSDTTHPGTLATLTYAPQGSPKTIITGCAGGSCTQRQETYDYNNRLQPVRIQLGTSGTPAANSCLVYNYYSGVSNPSTCSLPSQASTGNNRNVVGYLGQDTSNPSLGNTESFTYDPMNRLTTSVATGSATHNLTFSYDRYGNMTCVTNQQTQGLCPNWTFNAATNQINNIGFTYDAAGDLTQDGTGVGTHTYQWDAHNRLKSVDNGTTATYTYNALGMRVEKVVGTVYTETIYDSSGEPVGNNNRSAWTLSVVPFQRRHLVHYANNSTYFTHVNGIKSTSQVTDYSGSVTQDQLYYPFGQEWSMVGTMQEDKFAELQHRDAETSLDPAEFRTYSSNQGRWLTPDPIFLGVADSQQLNRYAYVANNPLSRVDPRGLGYCGAYCDPPPCITPPPGSDCIGGGIGLCSYYQDLIAHGDACDVAYAIIALGVCIAAGEGRWENCVRGCLINNDIACRQSVQECDARTVCRELTGHTLCFAYCIFCLL